MCILLGRSRATEDVDFLIPQMTKEEFNSLWQKLQQNGFWCINTLDKEEAFDILKDLAIKFGEKLPVPNMEFKIIKTDLDRYSYENKIKVILKEGTLHISPLEMQIAFKLFLSSEEGDKDIEDARHVYKIFKEKLNKQELLSLLIKLNALDKLSQLEK